MILLLTQSRSIVRENVLRLTKTVHHLVEQLLLLFRCPVHQVGRLDTRETCNEILEDDVKGWDFLRVLMQGDETTIQDLDTCSSERFLVDVGWGSIVM